MEIVGNSLEELFIRSASILLDSPTVAPRGQKTKERIGVKLILNDPRARVPTLPVRKFSLAYAMGELAWYCKGDDSVAFMERYAPSYSKYSDDGKRLHGAYGPRIFGAPNPSVQTADQWGKNLVSQWMQCKMLLERDSDSRQAVIAIYDSEDCGAVTKDMPCTLSLQFLIREGALTLITSMRSNDLWLGGLYDVFCFTALQELMANELGLPLGTYHHHVGSFHLYQKNWEDACRVIEQHDGKRHVFAPRIPSGGLPTLVAMEESTWLMTPADALDTLCGLASEVGHDPTLWQIGKLAWLWKLVSQNATVKEEGRRFARGILSESLGRVFETCFF